MKYKIIVKEVYFDEFDVDADSDENAIDDATKLWDKQHLNDKNTGLTEVQLVIEKDSRYITMVERQSNSTDWEAI